MTFDSYMVLIINKKEEVFRFLFFSTEGRDRTGTSVTSLVFETNASTYSATSAQIGGKNTLFLNHSDNYFSKKIETRFIASLQRFYGNSILSDFLNPSLDVFQFGGRNLQFQLLAQTAEVV